MSYKTLRVAPYVRRTNRCDTCRKFKSWESLTLHFTPDTAFSSEDESFDECADCRAERNTPCENPAECTRCPRPPVAAAALGASRADD